MENENQAPDLIVAALQQCHGDLLTLFTEFNVLGPLLVAQKYHLMVNDSYQEFSRQFTEYWDATYGPFFTKRT